MAVGPRLPLPCSGPRAALGWSLDGQRARLGSCNGTPSCSHHVPTLATALARRRRSRGRTGVRPAPTRSRSAEQVAGEVGPTGREAASERGAILDLLQGGPETLPQVLQ